jgi:ribosomal protein L9
MRAAAKFMLKKTMAAITLRAAEVNRLNGRRHELEEQVAQRLKQQLELLRALDSIDRLDILQAQKKQTQRIRSKKNQLPLLKDGWQDKFLLHNERSATYCDAGVLMRFCGLREAEFETGVDVELQQQEVIVKILGAKVRPGISGQPWRIMKLNSDLLPRRFLEKLKVASRLRIAVSPEGFRQHVKRTTEEVIGRVMDGDRRVWLTPYLFRHALVTDLRYAGWEQQEIARVLGELAVDTVRVYGRRVRAGSKHPSRIAIIRASVHAALPVRDSTRKSGFSIGQTKQRKVPHA